MQIQRNNSLSPESRKFAQDTILRMRALVSDSPEDAWGDVTTMERIKYPFVAVGNNAVSKRASSVAEEMGWHRTGAYSAVFAHPTDDTRVLKFFLNPMQDACLSDWIAPIYYENLQGAHMPKVYALDTVMGIPVAEMKRYEANQDAAIAARFTAEEVYNGYTHQYDLPVDGTPDIHSGNILFDEHGTFIITDPCC